MKSTIGKIGIIISIILIALLAFNTSAMAVDPGAIAGSLTGTAPGAQGQVTDISNKIIGVITTIGVVVAVIVLLVLGIKYMMGSASERAEYKKTMIPYLVGAVLIFGASAITKVVVALGAGLNK